MLEKIESILALFVQELTKTDSKHNLLHHLKPNFLGKDSELQSMFQQIAKLDIEQKKIVASKLNEAKNYIENEINKKLDLFEELELNEKLNSESIDGTEMLDFSYEGSVSPLTKGMIDAIRILNKYGFEFHSGLEIEEDFYNFQALNIPKHHPARQMQDTFYLEGKTQDEMNYLLRTHTTCVDIRAILSKGLKPPFGITSCGKVFRVESDKTHSPMFHQVDAIMVERDINMGNLKFLLQQFLNEFFEVDNIEIRFRPSFFPFTEPSAEIDIGYKEINGKIVIGGSENFLEVGGCGMIHPNVLDAVNIDKDEFQAIAFGMGLDRLIMLKYGITDVRQITANNLQWINHYSFDSCVL
jgi:phenylalanyl-tRNA synthetase alpha chain